MSGLMTLSDSRSLARYYTSPLDCLNVYSLHVQGRLPRRCIPGNLAWLPLSARPGFVGSFAALDRLLHLPISVKATDTRTKSVMALLELCVPHQNHRGKVGTCRADCCPDIGTGQPA